MPSRATSALYSTDGHAYYLPRLPTKSHVRTGLLSFSLQEEKTLHDGPQRVPKSRRSSCHRSTPRLQNSYLPARARAPLTPAPSFACSCSFASDWVACLAHQGPRGKKANHPVTRSPSRTLPCACPSEPLTYALRPDFCLTNRTLHSRRSNPL